MLNSEQFATLNQHLNSICHTVPYKWGRMQTKEYDRKLPKLYEYETYDELNEAIARSVERGFIPDDAEQNKYYQHRWYVYRCSLGDEYIFKNLPDVIASDDKDPWQDFTIAKQFNLDLKGTVILKQYKDDPQYVFDVPLALIDSLYKQQSQDFSYRRRYQNRLFLVHHSFIDPSREPVLRAAFDAKAIIFSEYVKLFANPDHKLYPYFNRLTDIIFFVEREDGTLDYGFGSENQQGSIKFKQLSFKLI